MMVIKGIVKTIIAGVVAVAILSGIMCFYSITPLHHENHNGNTDYIWTPNSIWIKFTEGISWGRFDSDGYNNPKVITNPDIIILGSSHMEALNVFFKDSLCGQLMDMFKNQYNVYNLGISNHNFAKVCQYLPVNLGQYDEPPKVTLIEAANLRLSESKVEMIMNNEVERTPSYDTGIIAMMQRVPFTRCLYRQIESGLLMVFMTSRDDENRRNDDEEIFSQDGNISEAAYDQLFKYLSALESEYGTQIVIFNHPKGTIDEDGSISFSNDEALKLFGRYAKKYNIDFIDMTSAFEEMYYYDHFLPHGFVTGRIGYGHLNAHGHAAIAKELYCQIKKMEEEGVICK